MPDWEMKIVRGKRTCFDEKTRITIIYKTRKKQVLANWGQLKIISEWDFDQLIAIITQPIRPSLAFSGDCRGDCRAGRVTGGTADEERRPAATPPIKKVSRKFSHNDKQEGGYFQLTTDTFTVASYWFFSSAEVQKPITRRKISQNYALYVCFYVAISGIRQYITLLPVKMSQIIKQSGYELHVQENLDPGYDPGCHSLS